MYQIIATNQTIHTTVRLNPRTGRSETIETVLPEGRIIAEHQTREITEKHCAKIRRCHSGVTFTVKEN